MRVVLPNNAVILTFETDTTSKRLYVGCRNKNTLSVLEFPDNRSIFSEHFESMGPETGFRLEYCEGSLEIFLPIAGMKREKRTIDLNKCA